MITVDCAEFGEAFSAVAACVPTRTPKDVLKNVKVSATGETLLLSATDSEIHMQTGFPYRGGHEECLFPAAKMLQILRELDGGELRITISEDRADIRCGSAKYRLSLEPVADFPPVPVFNADSYIVVSRSDLAAAVRKTSFSIDPVSTRYALNGINLEPGTEKLNLISTDGKRMSFIDVSVKVVVGNPVFSSAVVPVPAMRLIEKSSGEDVRISIEPNTASFQCGETSITSQRINGRFPEANKVIPEPRDINQWLTVPVGSFAKLVRQARVMESPETKGADFRFGGGNLSVSTGHGAAAVEMPLSYDGPELLVRLDGSCVADLLKVIDGSEAVEIGFIETSQRILFSCGSYRHVIMPMDIVDQ